MKKLALLLPVVLLAVGLLAAPSEASGPRTFRARTAKIAQDIAFGDKALININNMSMWFKRDGYTAGNPYTDNSGLSFPRSTDYAIYRDGLVWGGKVMDGKEQILRVGGSTYAQGCVPGRIISQGVADDQNDPRVRIYRVRRDWQTADLRLETAEYLDKGLSEVTDGEVAELRAQYQKDWNEWPAAWGAPYYDKDGNGAYDPTVDEPGVATADQVAWFVINDLDVGASQALYGALPIGIECQVLMWGYARTDALGDAIFKKLTVIYKGTADTPADAKIEDMYFAQWSDPDLGDAGDDFAGCDVGLSLGYVYNSTDRDAKYQAFNLAPPAAGYDFLQGPMIPVYLKDETGAVQVDENGNPVLDETSQAIFNFQRRAGYKNLPMTAFVYFAAGSSIDDPELNEYIGTLEWYNLLRGYEPQPDVDNPTPFTNPLTGEVTKFTMDGDPVRATGWNDGVPLPPGDRRIVLATGPFSMALGDTQEVVVAVLAGISTDRLRSISKLKFNDQFVQDAYNSLFEVPKPPVTPKVRVAELDGAILLDWGWDADGIAATEADAGDFAFEGYNLYQLASAEASLAQATKVATYDLENGVATIQGISLDEKSGVILSVPLQIGTDAGVRRYVKVTQDLIKGGPLVNGQQYYFAVTAYNRNTVEGAAVTALESPLQMQVCVPQAPPPGTRYLTEAAQAIPAEHPAGGSDGGVTAVVVDPTRTTGATYRVSFATDEDGATTWSLANTTTNRTMLTGQADQEGNGVYVGAEGFEVKVSGPPLGMKDWCAASVPYDVWRTSADAADSNGDGVINIGDYLAFANTANDGAEKSATRRWTWANADWGTEGFGPEFGVPGAITGDVNNQWFTTTTVPPSALKTVEIRFTTVVTDEGENQSKPVDLTNVNVSYAYRYLRGSGAAAPAPADQTTTKAPYDWSKYIVNVAGGYAYQDRSPICLSAWDMESNPPRRLEVGFLENNQPGGLVNGAYGPAFNGTASNIAGGGPREWLFVWDLPYTEDSTAARDELKVDPSGEPTPLMWIVFAARRQEARFPQDGDSFLMVANHVNSGADQFTFTVPGAEAADSLAAADVKLINVFPNPYYAVNEAETSPYQKFVTFSHLPPKAVIRIYDLGGVLVRKLEKDDPEQFLRWDLNNHNALPVASGLYIAHVDLPDLNKSRVLKLAIVQEQQFLENF
ncbi:MAG: T9SS type A sorting domain-containing protein [Candidatus Latescibacterota bacterium]|jgi:hypothetical protein